MSQPLLIAAPDSGQGKTTVAAGLARLHTRHGRRERCRNCGPDFITPTWLQAASGQAVAPLDRWLVGEDDGGHRVHGARFKTAAPAARLFGGGRPLWGGAA
jgi:cobyrinic acid a,c-diamide synthase